MFGTDRDGYTPRQPYQFGCAGAECVLVPPATRLAPLVHYYWTLSIAAGRVALPVVPDNAVDLVLCPETPDYAELFFPVAEPFEIPIDGPATYVGACLRTDRLGHAFGRDTDALRRLAPGLETRESLGLGASIGRLRDVGTDTAAIAATFDAFFGAVLEAGSRDDDASARFEPSLFELFLDAPESERIADTARRAGSSERQFRRDVRRLFGLGPKKLQRVVRLQRVLGELVDGSPPRADYHDEAHRIHELKALTGWTPGEIRRMAENYNTARRRASRLSSGDPEPET